MKQVYKNYLSVFLLGFLIFFPFFSFKASSQTTYYSRASGNWDDNTKWSTVSCGNATNSGTHPVAGDNVFICNGNIMSVDVNSACANVTMQGSGILDFPTNNRTLAVSGNLSMSGTSQITGNANTRILNVGGTFIVSAGSSVNIGGIKMTVTGISTISGSLTCIDNTGSKSFNDDFNIINTGSLLFNQAETYAINGDLNAANGSTLGGGAATGVINVSGDFNVLSGSGVVSLGKASLTVSGTTTIDGSLYFSTSANGNKSFRAVTITSNGKWDNTIGEDPFMNGNIVNNGNWIGNTGGTATYQFGRTTGGSYTISGNPVVFDQMTFYNNTTVTNLGTIIIDGGVNPGMLRSSGTSNVFNNGNASGVTAVLYLQNGNTDGVTNPGNSLTFNTSFPNNTVYYGRGGDQNIRNPDDGCYYNLICSQSGIKKFQTAGTIGIKNMLTIQDNAILDVATNSLANGCSGTASLTMTDNAELDISKCATTVPELTGVYNLLDNSTILLDGACSQTLRPGISYNNLSFSGSGTITMTGVSTINGNLTISGSATITGTTFTMDCSHTFTYNSTGNTTLTGNISLGNFSHTSAGHITDGGYTITVCGSTWNRSSATANYIATGRVTFNPSSGSCSVTSLAAANITQFHSITINSGAILINDVNGINIGSGGSADWTNNGTFTNNSSIVTSVGNITILGSSITTFHDLTINSGTLTGHATEMDIDGNWINNSTFTHNNGVVVFTGGNAQSLAGSATTTFYKLQVNKAAGTILTQNASTATVNNLLTMTEGIYTVGTNTLNGGAGLTVVPGTSDLQLAKLSTVPELTGTYSIGGGTVTLNGAGAQTLRTSTTGGGTYFNLVFNTSGAKTITNLMAINGNVTVSGSATLTANSAFVQASGKIFNYNSSGTTTLAGSANVSVGSYSQTSGTVNINGNNFSMLGTSWNKSGGTFTNASPSRVIFNGSTAQFYTDNGTIFSNVTINNNNGISLNNDISILTNLNFTSGNIITGSNNVIFTATTTAVTGAGSGTGFVFGNLRKAITAGASVCNYEVGTGSDYTPVNFSFGATTTAGNLTCSSTDGDNPNIFASSINESKTVNRYWSITNNTIGTLNCSAAFNWVATDPDVAFVWSTDTVQQYDGVAWNSCNIGTRSATSAQITGLTTASGQTRNIQIGNDYNATTFWNRVTGAGNNWNVTSTWIQDRKGGITTSSASNAVTGNGTKFTSELAVGDIILTQTAPGTVIGTVAVITDDTHLTLSSNAAANNVSQSYGREQVPTINDKINIGNLNLAGSAVTVAVNVPNAACNKLTFTTMAQGNTLTHNAGSVLTVQTSVNVNQPSNGNTNSWNINTGTVTVSGNIQIGSSDATAGRIAKIYLTSGTLNIGTNLVYANTVPANALLDLTGGAGRVNLSGSLTLNSAGTLSSSGTENIFNYNRTLGGQTVTFGSSIVYRNLYLNNTSASGAKLGAAVTNANVTGDIHVQTGIFDNGGFAIAGNAARKFQVDNGATFSMTGTAVFPTGFNAANYIFGATSITEYWQTNAQTITAVASPGYGHLWCMPSANGISQSTPNAATVSVQKDLIIGNSTNTSTLNGTATTTALNVGGNIQINPNAIFDVNNITNTSCGANWENDGTFIPGIRTVTFNGTTDQVVSGSASQTFYNIIVTKTSGTNLSFDGAVTTLNSNNITMTSGDFNAPSAINLIGSTTASMILNGGNFNAGPVLTINGNWTNNGGTFTPNSGLVKFVNGSAVNINGTAASQTFYDLEIAKSAGSVSVGGSSTTLIIHDFTQTSLLFNASGASTLFMVTGNFLHSSGIFTPSNQIKIGKDITNNNATGLTWGTNVTLNGSSEQFIKGTQAIPAYTNLTINNTFPVSAVKLNAPINVNGIFTLTDGHVVTDVTNILTLGANASVVAPVIRPDIDSAFVKGPMINIVATASQITKKFPVGKDNISHYSDLIITQDAATSTNYTSEYFNSSATALGWSLPSTLSKVSDIGHWDISKSGGANVVSASVNLYYLASYDVVTDPTNLNVAKGDPNSWIDLGGANQASGYVTSTVNFTTFSKFSLANKKGGSNLLPIELLYFSAIGAGNKVNIEWTTTSETNNDFFTIEKSKDGSFFETLKTLSGAGNSNELNTYKAVDINPYIGLSYYRLMQTDFDGKFSYSDIVPVNFVKPDNTEMICWQSGTNLNLNITSSFEGTGLIELFDNSGKLIYNKEITIANSITLVTVNDYYLKPGFYIVRATLGDRPLIVKIIIR